MLVTTGNTIVVTGLEVDFDGADIKGSASA